MQLQKKKSFGHQQIESLKNWVEIIAIVIGGIWAFFYFCVKDRPELEKAGSFYGDIHIDSINEKMLHVNYDLHIKNIGKIWFDVDSVTIRYWKIPLNTILKTNYFSIDKYASEANADTLIDDLILKGHYARETEANKGFDFFFESSKDSSLIIQADIKISSKTWLFFWEHSYQTTNTIEWHILPSKRNDKDKKE